MKKINNYNIVKAFFTGILLILISVSCNLQAQSKDSVKQIAKPSIILKDGATLFSADNSFNSQISDNKIVHDKASIARQDKKKDSKRLEMSTPKESDKKVGKDKDVIKQNNNRKIIEDSTKKRKKISIVFENFCRSNYC
ncbi:hypothetical protein [Chryseobacterium sp. GP-SGM7]|uniref:hypothetical protein n=1 Tax=Chryseobacterium sp. GP-SGM7 TaxID=3411323 RepID=UPI003B962212